MKQEFAPNTPQHGASMADALAQLKQEFAPNTPQHHVANIADALEQLKRSGSIYFVKPLCKSALQHHKVRQTAKLSLPQKFLLEHGDKFEGSVTLRVRTSTGRSSRSWHVRVCVFATLKVQIVGGWPAFVAENCLEKGDSVIFVLREDAVSEFEVHVFRGPWGAPYFPIVLPSEEDEEGNESDSDMSEGHPAALRRTRNPPRFCKELVTSHVGRPARAFNLGQFEFPARFIRAHGDRVGKSVKIQGIHENSLNYAITCNRRAKSPFKVYFSAAEWSRFVRENALKEGQVLQFTLMADSYFLVRRIA